MTKRIGHLHVLTDETVQNRFTHVELSRLAMSGGADTIQFREKQKSTRELIAIATEIRRHCRDNNVTLIINDRTDVALAVDADGVHVGRRDLPIPAVRTLLGPQKIIGGSAATLEEALQAERDGADYVGFGHIFKTTSKDKPGTPTGPDVLREISRSLTIPVIAIGGIDKEHVPTVLDAGAWGVAVIAAVCAESDPAGAAKELRRSIDRHFDDKE